MVGDFPKCKHISAQQHLHSLHDMYANMKETKYLSQTFKCRIVKINLPCTLPDFESLTTESINTKLDLINLDNVTEGRRNDANINARTSQVSENIGAVEADFATTTMFTT